VDYQFDDWILSINNPTIVPPISLQKIKMAVLSKSTNSRKPVSMNNHHYSRGLISIF
jgi:hypothetical protein